MTSGAGAAVDQLVAELRGRGGGRYRGLKGPTGALPGPSGAYRGLPGPGEAYRVLLGLTGAGARPPQPPPAL